VKLSSRPLVLSAPLTLVKPALRNETAHTESDLTNKLMASSLVTHSQQPQTVKERKRAVRRIFSSTFLTIFLAEMGDKTQLATLLISAQSQSPWVVFAGAAAALIATSLLGVLLGRWLANRLSPKTLETAAGALLLFISVMLLWDVVQLG
jgi:putative Ca2+/H+ antiporter (TMEM165/GDT1 family)